MVWRLDQLGRSMHHLLELIGDLRNRGVGFQSVSDGLINTMSPSGELIFHIFSALAQFERRLIQERTRAGHQSELEAEWAAAHRSTSMKRKCGLQYGSAMIIR